jgi:DNA repair exonuclease SbcCD ATPase subunit
MKIKTLFTQSFGKFNTAKWSDFSPSINVFVGVNEAGKSTVFKMISRVLFGFKVTSRDKNLLINQSTGKLHVAGEVESEEKLYHIERELLSKPKLSISSNGQLQSLENETLQFANHINRMTFEEVYALDLHGLTPFKDQAWQEIEELLMQQYSGDVFRSPASVLAEIEVEMKKIKKQSDRGNSIIKSLDEQRRKLFKQKKVIQDNLSLADELNEKILIIERKLDDIKKEKHGLEHQKMLLDNYLPVMRLLEEQKHLDEKLEGFKNLAHVDEYQYKEKKNQLKKLYAKLEEVSAEVTKIVQEKRRLTERVQSSRVTENELKDMIQKHIHSEELSLEKETLEKALMVKEETFKKAFEETFDEHCKDEHYDEILDLNYLNIKSLVKEIEAVYEEIKIVKRNKRSTTGSSLKGRLAAMTILSIIGGVAIYLNLHEYVNYAGAFTIGLSISNSVHMIIKNKNKVLDEEDLFIERDTLRERLIVELNGIRLSKIAEEFIGQELLTQIMNLKNLAEVYLADKVIYDTKYKQMLSMKEEVNLYLNDHVGEIEHKSKHFDELMDLVKENQKNKNRIEVINGQLDVLNNQLQETEKDLNESEEWMISTEKDLTAIGGTIEQGLKRLNSKAQDVLRRDELIKRLSTLDYAEDILKVFCMNYSDDKRHDVIYIQSELERLNEEQNEMVIRKGGIEKDKNILLEQSDLTSVESELIFTEQRLKDEKIKYDRLLLMHHLIKETDERFRTENQPKVFLQASGYLNQITDGRYSNLEVVELKDNSKIKYVIMVDRENQKIVVDETLSMGTLNQIYLSLRLSLIDHLDRGRDKLPVCFDELLVNWDKERLSQTLKIIETISKERQVFVFTCHDWFADALKSLDNAKVYQL